MGRLNRPDSKLLEEVQALRGRVEELERMDSECQRLVRTLHESEERLRLLYERAPLGYQSLDDRGCFLEVNQAWLNVMGYKREEVIGRWFGDFLVPECVEQFRRHFPCFKTKGEVQRVRFEVIRKDGSHLPVEYNGRISYDAFGQFERTHCIMHDISEQRLIEQALESERQRLMAVLEMIPAFVFLQAPDCSIRLANRRFVELFGDPKGGVCYQITQRREGSCVDCPTFRVFETQQPQQWEWAAPDGRVFVIHDVPFWDSDGSPLALEFGIDITDLRRAEQDIREWMRRYELAVAASGQVAYDYDVPSGAIIWGSSIQNVLGYEPDEIADGIEQWVGLLHPEDRDETMRRIAEAQARVASWDAEYRIRHKAGHYVWVRSRGFFIASPTGQATRQLGMLENITGRKQAEENRLRLEAELRHAQKMEAVGTLATGIAHDFNNLLTAVSGNAELARAALGPDHPARQYLDVISTAIRDTGGIANSLLTFSRKTLSAKAPVDLRQVVKDALKLFRRILPAAIELRESVPADRPVFVCADVGQLHHVLMNLVTNARDAMPNGGVLKISLLEVSAATDSPTQPAGRGGEALLVVEDTGVGMSPEVVSQVFDPFFTTKPRGKGTGLGMAMVHGIMEEHDATIHIQSQPGKGTRISVRLRCCDPPDRVFEAEELAAEAIEEAGRRILLAEDNEFVRAIMVQTLTSSAFEVVAVASGAAALEQFTASPDGFSLVILDVDLPEMSGPRCLQEIRRLRPGVPALLVTGSPDIEADDDLVILRKPFKMSQLASLARILLTKS